MNGGRGTLRATLLLLSLLVLGACDGNSGATGAAGVPGPPGPGVTASATKLKVTITGVRIPGKPVVDFRVTDQNDVPLVRLSSVRFTLAKLIPGTDGNASAWQNYINRVEIAGTVGPGTEDKLQGTTDGNGELIDHGDGRYTYTFANDVTQITAPQAVPFEPGLTHRIAMQLGGGSLPAANAVFTWRPSDGATTGIFSHDIVQTASCNECHGKLALHGGGRTEVQYCVTCHNPGSADANSGNTVDFKVMIHKIHRGESLPSVEAGGEYAIWGFGNRKFDYSHGAFPQDIRNCSKCHDVADTSTPQADRWMSAPTREACGACHDHVNFETGENHSSRNIAAKNSECTVCHSDGGFAGSVAKAHRMPAREQSANYKLNIINIAQMGPGEFPVVNFSVTNPAHGNTPYDLLGAPEWTSSAASLSLLLAWDSRDYHNQGNGSAATPASAVSLNAISLATANGDGSYKLVSSFAIPADASGTGGVSLLGRAGADFDGDGIYSDRVPIKAAVGYAPITDSKAVPRRQVVDIARCDQCHDQLSLHGASRTDEPQMCVMCHNANNTDIARRPADSTMAVDGKKEQSVDFKTMIHSIHAAGYRENDFVVYGFRGSVNDFSSVVFPGIISNCETCHRAGTYMPPLLKPVLATTVDSGPSLSDPVDDANITATAAACSSCHDSSLAQAHMEQNGASFSTPQSMVDNGSFTETCAVCHGSGRVADVTVVHKIPQ